MLGFTTGWHRCCLPNPCGTQHGPGLQGDSRRVIAGRHMSSSGRSAGLCCFARCSGGAPCALNLSVFCTSQIFPVVLAHLPRTQCLLVLLQWRVAGGLWVVLQEVQLDLCLQVRVSHIHGGAKEGGLKWISRSEVRRECHTEESESISGMTRDGWARVGYM